MYINKIRIVYYRWDMLKQYNIRIDPERYTDLKKLNGTVSEHIRNAIDTYLQTDTLEQYNVSTINILKDQLTDLKQQRDLKEEQIQQKDKQIMLMTCSWWQRRKLIKARK